MPRVTLIDSEHHPLAVDVGHFELGRLIYRAITSLPLQHLAYGLVISRRMVRHVVVGELERPGGCLPLPRPDPPGHDVRAAAGGKDLGGAPSLQPTEALWSSIGKPRHYDFVLKFTGQM